MIFCNHYTQFVQPSSLRLRKFLAIINYRTARPASLRWGNETGKTSKGPDNPLGSKANRSCIFPS